MGNGIFISTTWDSQKDVGAIMTALEQYFTPAKNVIFKRYVFGNLKQEDGELFDAFVTRLREKAASCDYGAIKELTHKGQTCSRDN